MKPKSQVFDQNGDLFKRELKDMVDPLHRLCVVADGFNWDNLIKGLDEYFPSHTGRPATASRLIAGLFYLKALYNISDDQLVHTWVENPYWQYLCGEQFFQHKFPVDRSVLSHWRKRIGKKGMEKLLLGTLCLASDFGFLSKRELFKVNVDTTVQEKAIRYPTDSKLYYEARCHLVVQAKLHGIPLRQSYRFKAKQALYQSNRYAHAKQFRRMRACVKQLKNYLGRVVRDIERYLHVHTDTKAQRLRDMLLLSNRLLMQTRTSKKKLYSPCTRS